MSRPARAHALKLAGLLALTALGGCAESHQWQPPKTQNPGPSRSNPTPGTRNPTAAGPQGSLPNPYTRPQ
jgi:hypothetical protein